MVGEADGIENFFLDNQPCIISDISSGDINIDVLSCTVAGEDQDKGKRVLDLSTSNSPNILGGGVAVPMESTIEKKRSANSGGGGGKRGSSELDHEIHIRTERERRKKMRNLFSSLQALIPHLPPKADKSTIVDEALSYIKSLEHTLKQLHKPKLEWLHGMSTKKFVHPSKLSQQKLGALMKTRESCMADQGSSTDLATINGTKPSPSFSNIPRFPTSGMAFLSWLSPNVVLNVFEVDAQISVWSFKKLGVFSNICSILDKHKLEVVSAHVFSDNFRNMYMLQTRAKYVDNQLPEGFLVGVASKQAAAEIMLWVTS